MFADTIGSAGVVIVQTTVPPLALDNNLWFNPTTKVLQIKVAGVWTPTAGGGGAGSPEVHIGATAPAAGGTELIWIDTSAAMTVVHYKVAGVWDSGMDGGRF